MALINFKLKHPDTILPWGDAPDTTMHWFGLTDGEYWLDLNKATFYEYTDQVTTGNNETRYVEYQLVRLIEDWTSLFESIAEPIPDGFYAIASSHDYLYRFYAAAQTWFDKLPEDANFEHYEKAIEWIYSRTLMASHLTAGPGISFFRNRDNLSIVWQADHVIENNTPVWTAQNGEIEMGYDTFIKEMEDFGDRFFEAMDAQVKIAVEKDWGTTQINKERLIQEQQERRADFQTKLAVLKGERTKHTDWELINTIITEMFS
jgi:hypothetical protein